MRRSETPSITALQQRAWYKRRVLAGKPFRVPAAPYIELLKKWYAVGFSSEVLAQFSGMPGSNVRRLMRTDRIWLGREFAERLDTLTAKGLIEIADDDSRVCAVGAVRRIRAIAWLGHPTAEFMPYSRFHTYATGATISIAAGEYRTVAARYRELSQVIGDNEQARRHAVKKRWPGPMAWDDDNIDDPFAEPYE